jgi:hypothetical protein
MNRKVDGNLCFSAAVCTNNNNDAVKVKFQRTGDPLLIVEQRRPANGENMPGNVGMGQPVKIGTRGNYIFLKSICVKGFAGVPALSPFTAWLRVINKIAGSTPKACNVSATGEKKFT